MSDTDDSAGTTPYRSAWDVGALPEATPGFIDLISNMRAFLDRLAMTRPGDALSAEMAQEVAALTRRLESAACPETDRICGRLHDMPGRAYLMLPPFVITAQDSHGLHGTVTFGTHFLGRNGAAHGGTVALLFDDILGRLVNAPGRGRSRTAYMHVDYRSITPVNTPLHFTVTIESEEGRKRILRGELFNGDTLCAEAHSLFIELKPDQP